jgi:fucose permease
MDIQSFLYSYYVPPQSYAVANQYAIVDSSFAAAATINVGNVLTPVAFAGADPSATAFATNLANVFFGLGAFLTPLASAWLLRRHPLSSALALLGGFALVPALLAFGVEFPSKTTVFPETADAGLTTLLADPMLWLCGMALFFYGPLEACMAAWSTTYLQEHAVRPEAAAGYLSTFWLAYMAARLTTALTLPPGFETNLILALSLASIAVLLGMVLTRSRRQAVILVPAAGLVFGPIFPTLMAVLLEHFPAGVHGRAIGLFFALGGIGWTIIPMILGNYARRTSVRRGFAVAVGAALGLSAVALTLVFNR